MRLTRNCVTFCIAARVVICGLLYPAARSYLTGFRLKGKMLITLYSYRAKPGQLESVFSLYRQWQQLLQKFPAASTEFLLNAQDPDEIIMLARFADESTAWTAVESTGYRAWYSRLVNLTEAGPLVTQYKTVPPI